MILYGATVQESDRQFGIDTSKWDGKRHFVAYWWFTSWAEVSFGFHISFEEPNIEVHLPFGFVRIGWTKCPVWPSPATPEQHAHDVLDECIGTIHAAVVAACESEPSREPYRSAIRKADLSREELLHSLDVIRDVAISDRGPCLP